MAMASRPHHRLLYEPPPGIIPCQPFPQCLLPPLPPPPPPSPSEDPATTIRFNHPQSSLVPTLPVAAASLVAVAVLAILVIFFFLRLRRRRRRRLGLLDAAPPGADVPLDEEDGGGQEVIHHVWYIRTVGLDESTIGMITAWAYKADDGVLGASATDCAVCLSDFCDGELVRLLPKCGHAFHVSCIDTWLRSHVNCPLCRAPVVAPNSAANSGDPGTSTASSSSSSARSSLLSPESSLNHAEPNPVASAQVDSDQTDGDGRQLEDERGTMEEEMNGERSELGGRSRTAMDPIASSQLLVSIDIGEDGFQPIRRSASMGAIIGALELEEGLREILCRKKPPLEAEWNHRTRVKHSSRVTSLRKEVERSSGSSSERFFLSIRGRGRSSLLPL